MLLFMICIVLVAFLILQWFTYIFYVEVATRNAGNNTEEPFVDSIFDIITSVWEPLELNLVIKTHGEQEQCLWTVIFVS